MLFRKLFRVLVVGGTMLGAVSMGCAAQASSESASGKKSSSGTADAGTAADAGQKADQGGGASGW